jgi:hypothetical protein
MIPQPFVKGAGERVFFGPYEYPPNADLIFDFGNPLCTSAFNSSRIVYNVGSANVTGSLIAYNNPGPFYPTLSTDAGGVMITRAIAFGSNYMEFNYSSSIDQTSITVFALNGGQLNPWNSYIPSNATPAGSSIKFLVYGNTINTGSAGLDASYVDTQPTLNVDVSNTRNGYNLIAETTNNTTGQILYVNTTPIVDTNVETRNNEQSNAVKLGLSSNMRIMAFLQYPRVLKPKEIRQINKVFAQRYFT